MSQTEKVTVTTHNVSCDGGNDPVLGHPNVYLTFKKGEKEIVCPYCSRHFILSDDARHTAH